MENTKKLKKLNEISGRYLDVDDRYQFDENGTLFNTKSGRKVNLSLDSGSLSFNNRCILIKDNGKGSSFESCNVRRAITNWLLSNRFELA